MAMLTVDRSSKRRSFMRHGNSAASWLLSATKKTARSGAFVQRRFQSLPSDVLTACACALLMAAQVQAQWTKEDTTGLTASSDWSPGTWTTSTTTGTMTFNTTLSAANAANLTLAVSASYSRLNFGTMNGPVTISGSRTMTLTGASTTTLDMSAASHDVTIDVSLTAGSSGGTIFNVGSGRTLTLSGGGSLPANLNDGSGLFRVRSSTAKLYTAGLATSVRSGDTTNNTGGVLIGDNSTIRATNASNGVHVGYGTSGLLRVDGSGAGLDINVGNVRVGRQLSANNSGKLLLTSGSIFNSLSSGTGTFTVGFLNTASNTRSIFEMQGGVVDLPANSIVVSQSSSNASTTSAEYLMKGGTSLTKGLRFGAGSTSGTGVLNMTGGELYLGTDGIQHLGTGSAAYNIILASGTLGAAANWTSSLNMRMREAFVITAADAGGTARNIELSGNLSNDGVNQGGFVKRGAGTLTLSGSNSYTGATTVGAGTLTAASNALANTSSIAVNGAYLSAVNYNPTASLALDATGSAAISGAGLSLGAVTNANNASNALDFTGNSGTITLASLSGAGSTRFQSDATITGGIAQGTINATGLLTAAISGGSVTAGSLSATGVSGGSVSTAGGATITTLSAGSVSVGGVATVTTMSGGTVGLNGVSASIATLNGGSVDLANNVALSVQEGTFGGTITGAGSLLKTGVGRLVFSGDNTYSGATQISAGILEIAPGGAIGSTSGVMLTGSTAELKYNAASALTQPITLTQGIISGTGTIGTALTFASGNILSPGNSPGMQAYTSLHAWSPGGTYQWELNALTGTAGAQWDLVDVTSGTFDLSTLGTEPGSKFILDLVTLDSLNADAAGPLASPYDGGSYTFGIATYNPSNFLLPAAFSNTAGADLTGLFQVNLGNWQGTKPQLGNISVKINSTATGIDLVIVPEPSALALAGLGMAAAVGALLRWRKAGTP